jgi:hypothetical protein
MKMAENTVVVLGCERRFHRPATIPRQRRDKDVVENKFGGKERKDIGLLGSNLEGEVSIKINFAILWAINILQKKSQNSIFELPFFTSMTELEHNRDDIIIITSKLEILY